MVENTITRESVLADVLLFCKKPVSEGTCSYVCLKAGIIFENYDSGVSTAGHLEERVYAAQNRVGNLCTGEVCAAPEAQNRRTGFLEIPTLED